MKRDIEFAAKSLIDKADMVTELIGAPLYALTAEVTQLINKLDGLTPQEKELISVLEQPITVRYQSFCFFHFATKKNF